ncbi:unnamed protein product [Lampetra planeri]
MENRCPALNVNVAVSQRLRERLEDGGLLHPRLRPRRQESGRLLLPLAEEAERSDWLPLRLALQEAGLAAADESDWPAPGDGLEDRGETLLARDWWLSSVGVSAPSLRGPRRRRGRPASSRLLHALRALAARKLHGKDVELRGGDVELRGGDELRGNDVELRGKDVELRGGDVELRGGDELRGKDVELRGKDVELCVGDVELRGGDVELWAREVPSRYERHGDLVVLPSGSFRSHYWRQLEPELWAVVARVLGASRVARCHRVAPDDFRSPRTQLLLGEHGHVVHRDNNITYEFDVTLCMFSKGNESEKLHLASLDCRGETIVDLYAGIGYLTLPLLVHAGAAVAVACEWSPHAVAALRYNLERNGVAQRCTVHPADNQTLRERGFADRVLLGLLPSSRPAWALACSLLRPDHGGILHIHHNVVTASTPTKPPCGTGTGAEEGRAACVCASARPAWRAFARDAVREVRHLLLAVGRAPGGGAAGGGAGRGAGAVRTVRVARVKKYAPRVDHVVVDLHCSPLT